MDWEIFVVQAFIYIFPAYIANSSAALIGGKKPLDFGKKLKDGRRILGNGKTFRGAIVGLFLGSLTGIIIGYLLNDITFYLTLGILLSTGAVVGDIVASFFKRRLGWKRGKFIPLLDQWDFLIGAIIFGLVVFYPSIETFLFLLIITPPIHLFVNSIGYLLKLKSVPW